MVPPGGDGSQLAQNVRPVLGDHRLVGKSPEGSRQPGGETRSPLRLLAVLPVHSRFGLLTCGSWQPVMTARARCVPLLPVGCVPSVYRQLRVGLRI